MNLGVVVLASVALLVAGCGGSSSSPGVAHLSSSTSSSSPASGGGSSSPESSASTQQKMVKFSQCMRTHGEPEFPEPTEGGIRIQNHNGHGPNPESSRFQAAEKACSKYAPSKVAPSPAEQAKMQEGALKFSACMRSHGVPNFPDPEFHSGGGGVGIRIGGKGSRDRSQLAAVQSRAENVPVRPAQAEGRRAGGRRTLHQLRRSGGESGGQAVLAP